MSGTQILVIFSASALLLFVLELVRRRRLREEYSWLWLLTAVGYFLVAVWGDCAVWVAHFIGSTNPVAVFAFLGLFFLILISIQFSVEISRLTTQNKDLAQQIAILDGELRRLASASVGEQTKDLAQEIAILDSESRRLASASVGEGNTGQLAEEQESAQRVDDRPGRLVSGLDQHLPAG